jgi:hypothetical protein
VVLLDVRDRQDYHSRWWGWWLWGWWKGGLWHWYWRGIVWLLWPVIWLCLTFCLNMSER